MHDGPGGEGLSRKAILEQVDASLTRLGTDYIEAETRGVSMAQTALAWVLRNPLVSAPIVGATKPNHLPEAVDALGLELTDDEVQELEAPYQQYGPSVVLTGLPAGTAQG